MESNLPKATQLSMEVMGGSHSKTFPPLLGSLGTLKWISPYRA